MVEQGIYRENIDLKGKKITLRGAGPGISDPVDAEVVDDGTKLADSETMSDDEPFLGN